MLEFVGWTVPSFLRVLCYVRPTECRRPPLRAVGRSKNLDRGKDFQASGLVQVRRLTAATAAITLACLYLEMLSYVLGRLHSSCVLSTRIGLHRIEVINKTLVNDDLSFFFHFAIYSSLKT